MFVFMGDLGLGLYTVREVSTWRGRPDGRGCVEALFADVLVLRFLLSLVAAGVAVGAAWLTGRPSIVILGIALSTIGLVLYGIQGATESVLSGFERLATPALSKVVQQLVFVLVGSAALITGVGYFGLIGANLLGVALMTLLCWRAVSRLGMRPGRTDARRWAALLRLSFPFGVIGFTLGLSYRFDTVLLSIFRGDVETGYYNAGYNLVFSAVVLSNVLNTALYPSLARRAASDPSMLPDIYARTLRYLMCAALPIAVGVWATADQLVVFLFGDSYLPAASALRIVIWVVPFMFASEFLGYVVVLQGEERRVARSVLISTAINVVANLILVPRFGLIGAAVMTVVTEMVLIAQYGWLLRAELRRLDWGRVLLRPLLAASLMGVVAIVARPLGLVEIIGLSAVSYLLLLWLLGVAAMDELRFLRHLHRSAVASRSL
jgi:O-antigen/teichoic acid export membrane protein